MWDWFYDMPTIWAFIFFVVLITLLSLLGLYVFKQFNIRSIICEEHNTIIGIFITIISVFLGVMLTFVIIDVWNDYDRARLDATKEALSIFILYQTVRALPDTGDIQDVIIEYLEFIINVEYPALRNMVIPPEGNQFIVILQDLIYNLEPQDDREIVVYNEAIDTLNLVASYRVDRLDSGRVGINSLVWWITIIDAVLLVIMSWFLICSTVAHYILSGIVSIYIASAVFLTLILSYPFRGYGAITPFPFVTALEDLQALI